MKGLETAGIFSSHIELKHFTLLRPHTPQSSTYQTKKTHKFVNGTTPKTKANATSNSYDQLQGIISSLYDDYPDTATSHSHPDPSSIDVDTIAAIVTDASQGSVSIIRLSGHGAIAIASQIFLPAGGTIATSTPSPPWNPESHKIYYGHAVDPQHNKTPIDEVLAFCMKAPRSYTSEDVIEIHTHGGGVCARRVLQTCIALGARLAKPGEFTLRAFLNGRLDLSQAESVAQLLEARTVAAADSALAGLSGGLGREISHVRRRCLDILVELDARLDFDEDLPPLNTAEVVVLLQEASSQVDNALATARQGQLLRNGLQIALIGQPNVGKSSLLNSLSGTEKAIVTDIPGTTRDVVEAGIVIGGVPVTLLDTAGLRDADDKVEKIGVERSMAAAQQADIVVMVVDGNSGWNKNDQIILDNLIDVHTDDGDDGEKDDGVRETRKMPPAVLVINKSDLLVGSMSLSPSVGGGGTTVKVDWKVPETVSKFFSKVVSTSACTGQGLEDLRQALLEVAGAPQIINGGISWAINERQAEALTRTSQALKRASQSVSDQLPIDFWTIDLRAAVLALGEVSGEEVTEEVLDSVFSKFCIGK